MASFAEAAEGQARDLALLGIHRNQFHTGTGNQPVQRLHASRTISGFDDDRGLHEARDRHPKRVGCLNGFQEITAADSLRMSVASLVETSIVIEARYGAGGLQALD